MLNISQHSHKNLSISTAHKNDVRIAILQCLSDLLLQSQKSQSMTFK